MEHYFAMLAIIRVTKAGHFLDAIMYSATIIYPEIIWFNPSHGLNMADYNIFAHIYLWA
jgi:hypothetical protein